MVFNKLKTPCIPLNISKNQEVKDLIKLSKKETSTVLVKVKKQRNTKTGQTRMVTEFLGNCIKFEPDSMADFIYTPIAEDCSQTPDSHLADQIIHKFKAVISDVDEKCKSRKLIEDVSQINNG
eukprot:CAMPEP_0168342064 /NCGR_PEP_ID=MMETSP0213-20121227/15128_1 /TAXON_ID=151035 /ORGANISM="Euplotes harpa, Strain FSP1.4" /LENGTH=122 /DNA_ID=CAMNT_0008348803 /DNA_START=216 /DNA_END=580 /DNA_ORIENTATION=+